MIPLKRPVLSNKPPKRPKGTRGPKPNSLPQELAAWHAKLEKKLGNLVPSDKEYQKKVGAAITNVWRDFRSADGKRDLSIAGRLKEMSHGKCSYCEREGANIIDHFWPKAKYPCKTFAWTNLFLSCSTCNDAGHKGDDLALIGTGASAIAKLLDPSAPQDDPYRNFVFTVHKGVTPADKSAKFDPIGWIDPRPVPGTEAYERALHTIDKLDLNPSLFQARATIIDYFFRLCRALVEFGPEYAETEGTGETVRQSLGRLLSSHRPHLGAIRQILRDKPDLRDELIAQMPELEIKLDAWNLEPPPLPDGSSEHK